ncbi:MAG: RNA methyltransferase [Planctomycetales bacterium]|nr:RNA methyltransferase [Planctomycetales bacterium]
MHTIRIDGQNDPRLSDFKDLRRRPSGRVLDHEFFVVEGQLIVSRAISSDFHIRSVVVEEGRDLNVIRHVDPQTDVFVLTHDQIRGLAGYDFHRGFLASVTRKPFGGLSDFQPDPVSLALVQTTDMENMGSMIRTAAAFGIRQILLDSRSVDPYSRRAMRVSMGAAFGMRFLKLSVPSCDLRKLDNLGVVSFAATLAEDSITIDQLSTQLAAQHASRPPCVLVMGNEADGLPAEVQASSTFRVNIPMDQTAMGGTLVDSLNVSVAAAILMHELTRRS